ncbi:hypothetical protein BCV70DRAFT_203921 [Testicularia cyperi]|uniref:Uncharacterized protein n=1 Tax=Testicularia cyperi TaxID=1882483 RepID=A0A317Y0K4_9BASI|nr:hypothetical protein BCV70DRAFT_203921 [Testicularia cyperi]
MPRGPPDASASADVFDLDYGSADVEDAPPPTRSSVSAAPAQARPQPVNSAAAAPVDLLVQAEPGPSTQPMSTAVVGRKAPKAYETDTVAQSGETEGKVRAPKAQYAPAMGRAGVTSPPAQPVSQRLSPYATSYLPTGSAGQSSNDPHASNTYGPADGASLAQGGIDANGETAYDPYNPSGTAGFSLGLPSFDPVANANSNSDPGYAHRQPPTPMAGMSLLQPHAWAQHGPIDAQDQPYDPSNWSYEGAYAPTRAPVQPASMLLQPQPAPPTLPYSHLQPHLNPSNVQQSQALPQLPSHQFQHQHHYQHQPHPQQYQHPSQFSYPPPQHYPQYAQYSQPSQASAQSTPDARRLKKQQKKKAKKERKQARLAQEAQLSPAASTSSYAMEAGSNGARMPFGDAKLLSRKAGAQDVLAQFQPKSASSAQPSAPFQLADLDNLNCTDDEREQMVDLVAQAHGLSVAPRKLLQYGFSSALIQACCEAMQIPLEPTSGVDNGKEHHTDTTSGPQTAEQSSQTLPLVETTKVEQELMSKDEQGLTLTPLEQLRKKALASKIAKAEAAARAAAAAEAQKREASPVDAETDPLLRLLVDRMRALVELRNTAPSSGVVETGIESGEPVAAAPAVTGTSRKRAYRDVDAVDTGGEHATGLGNLALEGDLAYGDTDTARQTAEDPPTRRQRISYADSFSHRPEMPSGDVDLDTPPPNFFSALMATSSASRSGTPSRQPESAVYARTETEAALSAARQREHNRFLDVPHGLNMMIELSDDEDYDDGGTNNEEELDSDDDRADRDAQHSDGIALGQEALTHRTISRRRGLHPTAVLDLRRKTCDELNSIYRSLNGLAPTTTPASMSAASPQPAQAFLPSTTSEGGSLNVAPSTSGGMNATRSGTSTPITAPLVPGAASAASAASPAPAASSREDLLRKELEIKQLMLRIQQMEDSRRSKSKTQPTSNNLPDELLSRIGGNGADTDGSDATASASTSLSLSVERSEQDAGAAERTAVTAAPSTSAGVRLDPALQKQREALLALLDTKRRLALGHQPAAKSPGPEAPLTSAEPRDPESLEKVNSRSTSPASSSSSSTSSSSSSSSSPEYTPAEQLELDTPHTSSHTADVPATTHRRSQQSVRIGLSALLGPRALGSTQTGTQSASSLPTSVLSSMATRVRSIFGWRPAPPASPSPSLDSSTTSTSEQPPSMPDSSARQIRPLPRQR